MPPSARETPQDGREAVERRFLPPHLRETELGTERRCSKCRSWWPEDRDFFHPQNRDGRRIWHSWCRACVAEQKAQRRAARR